MWQNKIIHRKKRRILFTVKSKKKKEEKLFKRSLAHKMSSTVRFPQLLSHMFWTHLAFHSSKHSQKNKWLATSMWQIKFYRQSTAVQILSFNGFRPFYIHFICELSRKLLDSGTLSADLGHLGITGYKTYPCAHFSLSLTTADIHLASLSFGYHHIPCCALSAHCSFCFM